MSWNYPVKSHLIVVRRGTGGGKGNWYKLYYKGKLEHATRGGKKLTDKVFLIDLVARSKSAALDLAWKKLHTPLYDELYEFCCEREDELQGCGIYGPEFKVGVYVRAETHLDPTTSGGWMPSKKPVRPDTLFIKKGDVFLVIALETDNLFHAQVLEGFRSYHSTLSSARHLPRRCFTVLKARPIQAELGGYAEAIGKERI